MNFLKNLFGGGGQKPKDRAIFFYVRPKMCQQILAVRVDLYNELSMRDSFDEYYVRKVITLPRCPFTAELEVTFDKDRRVKEETVTNGDLVTQADYEAYQESIQTD